MKKILALSLAVLAFSSFASATPLKTKVLKDACKIYLTEDVRARGSFPAGYCQGAMDIIAERIEGIFPEPKSGKLVAAKISVPFSTKELIKAFVALADEHPEWDNDAALTTVSAAAVLRGWVAIAPYTPAKSPPKGKN